MIRKFIVLFDFYLLNLISIAISLSFKQSHMHLFKIRVCHRRSDHISNHFNSIIQSILKYCYINYTQLYQIIFFIHIRVRLLVVGNQNGTPKGKLYLISHFRPHVTIRTDSSSGEVSTRVNLVSRVATLGCFLETLVKLGYERKMFKMTCGKTLQ